MAARAEVRAVVLAAIGPAFCAGADLNWMRRMADYTRDENLLDAAALAEMLRVMYECPKPTIARIQGDVYAGGMGLVAACDMAVSVDTANFCLSEVKLGLIPATISPYVIRAMGARAAHRYFLTAERFDAREAHRIGFVHEVVGADALDAKVAELTNALSSASPNAVRSCKTLVQEVAGPRHRGAADRPHRRRHCRHPHQQRRPRGRAVLPAKTQAVLAGLRPSKGVPPCRPWTPLN